MRSALVPLVLLPALASAAEPYKGKRVDHLRTVHAASDVRHFGGMKVDYTISYEVTRDGAPEAAFPVEYIRRSFELSYHAQAELLRERGVAMRDCKKSYSVHIYVLSTDTMFHKGLFDDLLTRPNASVYGLFDTTLEVWGNSNLIIGPLSTESDFAVLQHEFAHYWHNRLCLSDAFPDSEEHAELMERRTHQRMASIVPTRAVAPARTRSADATVRSDPVVVNSIRIPAEPTIIIDSISFGIGD